MGDRHPRATVSRTGSVSVCDEVFAVLDELRRDVVVIICIEVPDDDVVSEFVQRCQTGRVAGDEGRAHVGRETAKDRQ